MSKLSSLDLSNLANYLHYFHVDELKDVCNFFQLSSSGKKLDLIHRILTYLKSGEKQELVSIPEASRAKKGVKYSLAPKSKILMGAYKNDLATRTFFKKLIGAHFHFTAFGIDWINERWSEGDPPTYEEFASYWQKEYQARKMQKATPKKEWAYLNFLQRCSIEHPSYSKVQIGKAWEEERRSCVEKAKTILKKI